MYYKIFQIIALGLIGSTLCFGAHFGGSFGGGFHTDVGHGNWNHNNFNAINVHNTDIHVGNYHPGAGWVAPVNASPSYIINGNAFEENCQTVQQCDSNGNCTQNQDCE